MKPNPSEVDRVVPNAISRPSAFLRRLLSAACAVLALGVAYATPTISITSPTTGSTQTLSGSPPSQVISITTAIGSSPVGTQVSSVNVLVNGVSIGTVGGGAFGTYSITWNPTATGSYSLTATVTDTSVVTSGTTPNLNTATSPLVQVTVTGFGPTVSLTNPANAASLGLGAAVNLTATASATGSATVSRVDFLSGTTVLGSAFAAPYSFSWTPSVAGSASLTARVTDSANFTATSTAAVVNITVPSVTLTSPLNGAGVTLGSTVALTASASAVSPATVSKVEFLAGTTLVGTATSSPYTVNWTPSTAGSVSLTARVTDSNGAPITSSAVSVAVTSTASPGTATTVSITAPANNSVATTGIPVNLTATATAATGTTISSVAYYANGVAIGSAVTASPYTVAWTPSAAGAISITARATDSLGTTTTSSAVTVNVADVSAPSITLTLSPGTAPATTMPVGATRYALATVNPSSGRAITVVEFFINGTKVAEKTTSPYVYKFTAPSTAGSYTLLARATDNGGLTRDATLTLTVVSAVGTAPTVNLVSPAPNITVTPNSPVALAATASATGGSIANVQFYANGLAVGTPVTASPYTSTFTPTAPGTYVLEAIATDDRSNTAVSSSVSITAAFGTPTITLTAPRDGNRVTPTVPVTLTATAVGGSGASITLVEFFLDGALLGTDTTSPYTITWTPDASQLGAHVLTARVTDANSLTATSATTNITVASVTGSPPTVSIATPGNNANLQTLSAVNLVANAFDTDGTIASVEFYLGDVSIGLAPRDQTSNAYRLVYNFANANISAITPDAQGRYPIGLYAIARDNSGNQTVSTTINLLLVPSTSSAPSITIAASITTVTAGTPLTLLANAIDPDGSIASVQYFANGVAIAGGTSTTSPYTVNYTPNAAGRINVYGVATDDTGNTAVSSSVVITVTGNTAPVVSLARPTDNSTISTTGVPVFLEATASDADVGQTLAVIFLGNGAQIATGTRLGTTSTYRAVWTPTTANTYTITARATDSANAAVTSPFGRTVVVNNVIGLSPTIAINAPANGATVTSASTGDFRATATDADGIITAVEFFVNRVSIGQATRDQASNLWRTTGTFGSLNPGSYEVVAIATDSAGNLAASGTNNITVSSATSAAPTINIASDKSTVAFSQPVQLSANAFDADGTIASVQYFANGVSVGTSTVAPSYLANWTATASGAFNVYAIATDNTGNTAIAQPLTVTVKRNNPILDDDAFILQTYQDILVRNPNAVELANYSAQLAAGTMSRAQLVALLAADPSFVNVTNVSAAYYLLMNEWPTYTNYQTLFVSRANLAAVVGQILGSAEYIFKYGSVTATTLNASFANAYTPFASRLWQNAFGRGPSALELVQFHDNDTATATLGRGYAALDVNSTATPQALVGLNTAIAEFITRTNANNTSFRNLARAAALDYQLLKSQPTAAQITALAALPDTTAIATSLLANSAYTYRYVTILAQPASLTVSARSGALFRVDAVGQPPLAYQWLFNGAPIAGATNPLLSITDINTTKTGSYTVVVTSAVASTTSDPALLTLSTAPTRLGNISSRGVAGTGANVLTAGFVVTGTASKQMLIRVVGPTLVSLGINGFLDDPNLTVLNSAGTSVATNDNWGTQTGGAAAVTAITQATNRLGAFTLPNNSRDAVVLATLNPGSYTVQARGAGATTGVAIIEVYDASTALTGPKAVNVSTRAAVGTGENILIAGFVVNGTVSRRVLVRGIGPTLRNFGLAANAVLPDPQLKLLDSAGKTITTNDDWASGDDAAIIAAAASAAGAFPLTNGSKDSSILIMLAPGAYTAQLSGVGSTGNTGIGLVEVYDVDP
jgi:hypothetical protein